MRAFALNLVTAADNLLRDQRATITAMGSAAFLAFYTSYAKGHVDWNAVIIAALGVLAGLCTSARKE